MNKIIVPLLYCDKNYLAYASLFFFLPFRNFSCLCKMGYCPYTNTVNLIVCRLIYWDIFSFI